MKLLDSLDHKPVELAFGTSGLRGLVVDMTDLECYINTAGYLRFLADHDGLVQGEEVYVAEDLRDSSPRITRAVIAAIADGEYKPVYCGKIPTPALAYYALGKSKPCIMVSGSHIPADRNGIKFYKRGGEVMKEDEAPIRAGVAAVRSELYSQDAEESKFDAHGALRHLPDLGAVDGGAEAAYKQRYMDVFPPDSLSGAKIVVYQQSAVARDLLVDILQALGAVVTPIERSDIFIPIDTDKITEDEKQRFRSFAQKYQGSFAIVSADGDSDRPIVIDERGEFKWGDVLGLVVTEFLGARAATTVVSANDAVDKACAERGVVLAKTKIGSPYVISSMLSADARPSVAWELNGGFLTADDISVNGNTLKALPTRDAMLPILAALISAHKARIALSELFNRLPRRFTAADLIDGVPEDQIGLFRTKSNDKEAMQTLASKLFAQEFGNIQDIDVTDGVRIRFASDDVLHFRPSGNAPQFRVYTNASSQARADELVAKSIAKDGYITQLLRELV